MRKGRSTNGNTRAAQPNISTERLAVSVAEFAEMFSLSRFQGYNLVKTGKIPVLDFGGRIVIPMKWIREQVDLAKPRGTDTET